jgi:putative aldouronate transport system substrate-binding protein
MGYPGGLMALYNEGVLAKLTDHMDEWSPNLMAYFNEHPEMMKQAKDDNGDYFMFPIIRTRRPAFHPGSLLRGDILRIWDMKIPETIDEWDALFRAVKAAHPEMSPISPMEHAAFKLPGGLRRFQEQLV